MLGRQRGHDSCAADGVQHRADDATVAVNEFIFKQAVKVGDILSFFARIVRVGRTSITVEVEVFAERFALQGQYIKVTEARLTYVAIDSQGKPCPVPAE